MKIIITALAVITAVISKLSWIWPLIEFCLYLFKDKEFNFFSLWFMLISWIVAVVFILLAAFMNAKSSESKFKSSFQSRLEQMAKQRTKQN